METYHNDITTTLNPMQLQLLRMFSYVKDEEQMKDIQSVLCDYFFNKVEQGMDQLVAEGRWTEQTSNDIMNEHIHTPYVY